MFVRELIQTLDAGYARLKNRAGALLDVREWVGEKSVVEVSGWVKLVCRERGKIVPGTLRSEHNVWTNTGREYLALLMSMQSIEGVPTPYRSDRVSYVGAGSGTQLEDPGVVALAVPLEASPGIFLSALNIPDFPLSPARTTVRYWKTFSETELTFSELDTVSVSELGLFTNGNPLGVPENTIPRPLTFNIASTQAPIAYKAFEPVDKSGAMQLEVAWEIRF